MLPSNHHVSRFHACLFWAFACLSACSSAGDAPNADGGSTDGAPTDGAIADTRGAASADANGAEGDTSAPADVAKSGHYERCETSAQCPDGDDCLAPAPGTAPTCRTPCAAEVDCPTPAGDSPSACWPLDHHCGIYCAASDFIPDCPAGTRCMRPSGSPDGLCGKAM